MLGLGTRELIIVVGLITFALAYGFRRGGLKRIALYAVIIVVASAILWNFVEGGPSRPAKHAQIRRVVANPGDTLEIHDGIVFVNGAATN